MNKKGFTLVELIATIAILGIITIVGVVGMGAINKASEKKTFEREPNPNLIWMTAFYRLSNKNAWRSYMMTEFGWTNVLWWITENIHDGTTKFYITDRTDPIIMTYAKMYKDLFMDEANDIPEDIKEIILALNPSVEGEATSLYLSKLIKPFGIKLD